MPKTRNTVALRLDRIVAILNERGASTMRYLHSQMKRFEPRLTYTTLKAAVDLATKDKRIHKRRVNDLLTWGHPDGQGANRAQKILILSARR